MVELLSIDKLMPEIIPEKPLETGGVPGDS
jgi:hypothetical protein